MGLTHSKVESIGDKEKVEKIKREIHVIATSYILQNDFADMINLGKEDYCKKTVIITKDILKKHMSQIDINVLYDKITETDSVNKVYITPFEKIQQSNLDKCTKIAEFYVLIGHIFNLIKKIFLVNPDNKAEDLDNICNNRLNRTKIKHSDPQTDFVTLSNNMCLNEIDDNTNELDKLYDLGDITTEERAQYDVIKQKIKLNNEKIRECKSKTDVNEVKELILKNKDSLYQEYQEHVDNIEKEILTGQLKLINVLNTIFMPIEETNDKNETVIMYTIKPTLTIKVLQEQARQTRNITTKMYSRCEYGFEKTFNIQEKLKDDKKVMEDVKV